MRRTGMMLTALESTSPRQQHLEPAPSQLRCLYARNHPMEQFDLTP